MRVFILGLEGISVFIFGFGGISVNIPTIYLLNSPSMTSSCFSDLLDEN